MKRYTAFVILENEQGVRETYRYELRGDDPQEALDHLGLKIVPRPPGPDPQDQFSAQVDVGQLAELARDLRSGHRF